MKLTGKFVYLGHEVKVSKKTQAQYNMGLFQNGVETLQCMINCTLPADIKQYQEYALELEYNPKFSNISVTAINKAV